MCSYAYVCIDMCFSQKDVKVSCEWYIRMKIIINKCNWKTKLSVGHTVKSEELKVRIIREMCIIRTKPIII